MNFVIFLIFIVICFALLTVLRMWHDIFFLMSFSIGCGVSAAIYTSYDYPIVLGNIVFGTDSVLYMMFVYILIIALRDYGVKQYKDIVCATMAAILLSGIIELFSYSANYGSVTSEFLLGFLYYILSVLGSIIGCFFMFKIYKKLQDKKFNIYLTFLVCATMVCLINFLLTYGVMGLINQVEINTFTNHLLGDLIGKVIALILGCISYYIVHLWYHHKKNDIVK